METLQLIEQHYPSLFPALSFLLGAMIGSFLNVCIYRLPAGMSLSRPASHCPKCGSAIRWYQNIPVMSYLLLRGRCASCRDKVSLRYPAVELLTGAIFALLYLKLGLGWELPAYWVLGAALVTLAFIDLDHQLLPDVLTLPGIGAGLLLSFVLPSASWLDSVIGVVAGGGSLLLIGWVYEKATGREGLGGGDSKLLALFGAWFGWQAVLPIILVSSVLGSAVGVPLVLTGKGGKFAIPFGPFLIAGAFAWIAVGREALSWYLGFF